MRTIEELVETYTNASDRDLYEIYHKRNEYSKEANEALKIVLENRGGYSQNIENFNNLAIVESEKNRLYNLSLELFEENATKNSLSEKITSDHLSKNEIEELIQEATDKFEKEKNDQEIKPRTIFGGIGGAIIGGTIGGILIGIQLIQTEKLIFSKYILIGIGFISYIFIKLFTKQSKKNVVVLLLVILSVIYAIIVAAFVFKTFGLKAD